MLIDQLPPDSRVLMHAMDMDAPWTLESEALATITDLLYALLRVTVAANSKRGARGLPSFTFPRPRRTRTTPKALARSTSPAEAAPAPRVVRGLAAFEHDWNGNG